MRPPHSCHPTTSPRCRSGRLGGEPSGVGRLRLDSGTWISWRTPDPIRPASQASSRGRPPSRSSMARLAGCSIAAIPSGSWSGKGRMPRSPSCCGPASGRLPRTCPAGRCPSGSSRPSATCRPTAHPMDALRTAVSTWGAEQPPGWPPTVEQARELTAIAPTALAAFARIRTGKEPLAPDPDLGTAAGFLYLLNGTRPDAAATRALDAYFVVAAEHGFNASTFTARVITATRSDMASADLRRHRRAQGAAARRRADRGRQPAPRDRLAGARGAVDRRCPRPQGEADGLRASGVPRLRSACRGTPGGRRDPGQHGRLAAAGGRGRGHRAAQARRALPRPTAQDQRGVLHGGGAPGCGAAAGPVPGHVRAGSARGLDGACAGAGRRGQDRSGRMCATSATPSVTWA